LNTRTLNLLKAQRGRCSICGDFLLHADEEPQNPREWEQWLRVTREAIKKQRIEHPGQCGAKGDQLRLLHAHCRRRETATDRTPAHREA
jgi:RNA-directed DNA polymerase